MSNLVKTLSGSARYRHLNLPDDVAARLASDGYPPAGKPPSQGWVALADLIVDESYQRPMDRHGWAHVAAIAGDFRWAAFTPVILGPAEGTGGKSGFRQLYAIIDGQHRSLAALMRGFERVPCCVLPLSRAEQAKAFAEINGNVRAITSFHVFKAALAAGEVWAVAADAICRDSGCRLMPCNLPTHQRVPGMVFAHTLLRQIGDQPAWHLPARVALSAWRAASPGDGNAMWNRPVIAAWIESVRNFDDLWPVEESWRGFAAMVLSGKIDPVGIFHAAQDIRQNAIRTGQSPASLRDLLEMQFSAAIADLAGTRERFSRWIAAHADPLPGPPGEGA